MRILVLTQYFSPEIGATQSRVHTFARELALRGHEVRVVCEVPNHPQGVVREGFRGRPLVRGQLDGFSVRHVWVYTRPEKGTAGRVAFYGSYAALATLVGAVAPRPAVILASSPPLPVAAAAALVALRHRAPWVMDVRDLWPAAAVALGELSNPTLLRLAERLERALYANAFAITAVTERFVETIGHAVGDPSKVVHLPNGTTRRWLQAAELDPSRAALGLSDDRFLWTFAGNVGLAQGLETAIDAARLLGDDFQLLILGDGAARHQLEEYARARAVDDAVLFRDQVPPETAARHLRASDALLVSLADDPALSAFVPSKLYDCCAVGRPTVVAAAGEPHRLADAAGAALPVPPGDSRALAATIRRLRDDRQLRARLSESGRAFAAANLRERQVDTLASLLEQAAARARPGVPASHGAAAVGGPGEGT